MSVAEAAHRPANRGRAVKLWLGFLLIIAAGVMPNDGVLIEYEGRLEDGKTFDSSEGKGPVPLLAGQTIPGFAEALSKMQRGGRYHVHIPARLAYGANPPQGGPIPPNADLEYDVRLVQIVPNAAAMMQGGPPQQ